MLMIWHQMTFFETRLSGCSASLRKTAARNRPEVARTQIAQGLRRRAELSFTCPAAIKYEKQIRQKPRDEH
jgi:hypothetical protein